MTIRLSWLPPLLLCCLSLGPAKAETSSPTMERIEASQTIRIGYRDNEIPFSYLLAGKPVGYSIDICAAIVEGLRSRLGLARLNIDYVPASTASRFLLMRTGKIDIECASTTNNAERRKLVEFSYPHFVTATRFVALKSANVTTIADLAGRSVTSTTGTVNIEQLNAVNRDRNLNISVLLSRTHKDAFALVESGRAVAFVMDDILLAGLVAAADSPQSFVISAETFAGPEPYGLLLPPGDRRFKSTVNGILRGLYTSGQVKALYRKWFEEPIPPDGANLNLPISTELKEIFNNPREHGE